MNIKTSALGISAFLFTFIVTAFSVFASQQGRTSATLQEDVTTLRVDVGLVLVEVVVLDDKGKPLAGLKKEDFRIFQDDKEQPISTFDTVSEEADKSALPSSLGDIDDRSQRGKVVLFLFDQSTISSANSKLVIDAAEQYVRQHMHPYDLMGVAVYVQSIRITCPFTHDSTKVVEAIRRARDAFAGAAGRAVRGTSGAKELRSQVVDLFRGLKSLCSSLEPVRGRKTILLFTEDLSVPADVLSEYDSLVSEARKSDVTFFSLDARGQSESFRDTASLADTNVNARPASSYRGVNLAQFQNQTSATILRSLASQTSGYPIYNTDNLTGALDRVDLELGHYYILGFQSDNARSDGKPHKIEVKLNLKNAKLRYRDTYTDPHPTDPLAGSRNESSLRAALSSSAPATQMPVSFRPVYFYETPQVAQVPVFVKIGRGSIGLRKKSGQMTGNATIMGMALAEDGSTASRFSGEIHIAIGNDQAGAFQNQDLVYRNFLRLRPGKYHLKVVVMDEKGKTGMAEQDLSIPVFNQSSLAASSLIVSQEMVPLPGLIKELNPQMLSRVDPLQFKGFQIYVPVETEIDNQQPMVLFYRIFSAAGSNVDATYKARVQAIDEKGEIHSFPPLDLASSAIPASRTETSIAFMLPSRHLKPGKYHLVVETIEAGSGQTVTSEADFRLRGLEPDATARRTHTADAEQARPASAERMADDRWVPPSIDQSAGPVNAGVACSLPDVLEGAGKRIQELIRNVDRFTAIEVLEHQDVDGRGNMQTPETRKFDYMVSIKEVRGGLMSVEEFRNQAFSPLQLPGQLATIGTPSVVLIFHPRYIPDFDMVCDGLGDRDGQPVWLVRFEQRKDCPNNIHSYSLDGVRYDVRLRGRAWIKADTYQILRLETDLAETIPKIQLRTEHMKIEYQPVDFPERKTQLWLPKSAELYLDFRGHRFRRRHNFTDFKLFSVETKDQITPPKGAGPNP
jgi:VWFA-related protein